MSDKQRLHKHSRRTLGELHVPKDTNPYCRYAVMLSEYVALAGACFARSQRKRQLAWGLKVNRRTTRHGHSPEVRIDLGDLFFITRTIAIENTTYYYLAVRFLI
jgi:hypothetical protein